MAQHNALFLLTKSLTKSEKRYFKLFASKQKGNKDYIKLFDAIDNQKEFDDKGLKNKLGKQVTPTYFAGIKKYLFNMLIESLKQYSIYDTPQYKLKLLLEEIEILQNKGLYLLCNESIKRAKEIAQTFEMFHELIIINRYEYKIAWRLPEVKVKTDIYDKELSLFTLKQFNLTEYERLYRELYFLIIIEGNKNAAMIEKIFRNPLLMEEEQALSFKAKAKFHQIKVMKASMERDKKSIFISMQGSLKNFEESRGIEVEANPMEYGVYINNYLLAAIQTKHFDNCEHYLNKLRSLKELKIKTEDKNTLNHFYYIHALAYYREKSDYDKALQCIQQLETENILNGTYGKEQHRETIYLAVFRIFFIIEDYKKARNYLNSLLNKPFKTFHDFHILSRLLSLILNYELSNIETLESEIFSVERILKKESNSTLQFENIFITHFKKLLSIFDEQDKKIILESLKLDLYKLLSSSEAVKLEYFEFIPWVESKILHKSIKQILDYRNIHPNSLSE